MALQDLEALRGAIDTIDESIIDNLLKRSVYPLDLEHIQGGEFYTSLLKCVCERGELQEGDIPLVSETEQGLKAGLGLRFGMAKSIIGCKNSNGMALEDPDREGEILDRVGQYAGASGRPPEPFQMAFGLIMERMKELQRKYIAEAL